MKKVQFYFLVFLLNWISAVIDLLLVCIYFWFLTGWRAILLHLLAWPQNGIFLVDLLLIVIIGSPKAKIAYNFIKNQNPPYDYQLFVSQLKFFFWKFIHNFA